MNNKKKSLAIAKRIVRAEAWAYSYIRNMGNGTAAAKEVFGLQGNSAAQCASDYLTNPHVQKIIGEFLDAQRESLKKFTEQGNYFLTIVSQKLIEIINGADTSNDDCFKAMEKLLRLGGFEISEQVAIAKINAKESAAIRGRAVLPGIDAPGVQPGIGSVDNSRKVIFLLSPPPMPPGGTPTPALQEQWKAMGWQPGIEEPKVPVQTISNAPVHFPVRN